jgi:hypothetical protein
VVLNKTPVAEAARVYLRAMVLKSRPFYLYFYFSELSGELCRVVRLEIASVNRGFDVSQGLPGLDPLIFGCLLEIKVG